LDYLRYTAARCRDLEADIEQQLGLVPMAVTLRALARRRDIAVLTVAGSAPVAVS
jgi:hypothetical protein